MMQFALDNHADANGNYLVAEFQIAPARLVEIFGKPAECDGYKVSGEYAFVAETGQVLTIYDWNSTSLYDEGLMSPEQFWAMPYEMDFSIGGQDGYPVNAFIRWLKEKTA